MRKKILILVLICISFLSCMVEKLQIANNPEEAEYLKKVMECPLVFLVPKEDSEEIWNRINSWIAKYSSMKIQIATDYLIETYNPTGDVGFTIDVDYGYKAIKTLIKNEVEFSIICFPSMVYEGQKFADRNAHILAYYAQTGELIERFITK